MRRRPETSSDLLRLGLATYRLAILFAKDDGPLDVFHNLRDWIDTKRLEHVGYDRRGSMVHVTHCKQYKYWASLYKMIRCPFCLGVWFAFFIPLFPDWLIDTLAIAGMGRVFLKVTDGK